ncbi:hypothetical protein ABL78_0890 [Leptomonas seymouri]|uniref:Uncharacterized protein n=1 Tax=Leptomonas seymouri TaxID=5684 RepID=A0A0N1IBF5_LEPSE|nr:hypothetical protein ABL78_0890 [Leptomonas seymouri]|eukprot:KPI90030.1 hypothetical protein ABL78_0890 [Leptomonas seymouri]
MSTQPRVSSVAPANGTQARRTPLQSGVVLPSAIPRAFSGRGTSVLPHPSRQPQFEQASAWLPSRSQPPLRSLPPPAAAAAGGLVHLAPHSPAISRSSSGALHRQFSASLRGTPAAQRMNSTKYSSRRAQSSVAATNANTNLSPRQPNSSPPTSSLQCAPVDGPLYYVVGSAVVNPQLMVSPSVQGEIRGVTTLAPVPDAMRRPGIGPKLHNTHITNDTAPSSTTAPTYTAAAAATEIAKTSISTPHEGIEEESEAVVCVTGIRNVRSTTNDNAPYTQQAQEAWGGSLAVLRQLYGTSADDVIEVAQTNPRSGTLEPPRMQYHSAQELLPELTSTDAQLKAMASARRRIDWDVSIPTAATLPPPVITFTTANGNPVVGMSSISFTVNTSTLVMQNDYATERSMSVTNASRIPNEGGGLAATAAALTATMATATAAGANALVVSRSNGPKSFLAQEEKVGIDISREERIGSSGLYRIRHLVGLRQDLGEMVGLDRVLEYEVKTSSSNLFIEQPRIDASSGDLLMELNTSLQGTAKLVITGVDCGTVDANVGNVQRSSNSLICSITLKHGTAAATSGAAVRDRGMATVSTNGSTQYARVPSATARLPSVDSNHNNGCCDRIGAAFAESCSANRETVANETPIGSDGFALSLAHFSQEFGAADRSGKRNLSLSREATVAGAGAGANGSHEYGAMEAPRHNSLSVQNVLARTAALAGAGISGQSAVSGAYTGAGRSRSISGAGRRHRMSASSREGNGCGSGTHYLLPFTNLHDLRYRHYTEAARLCRLQQHTVQREKEQQEEAERLREAQLNASSKSESSTTTAANNDDIPRSSISEHRRSQASAHPPSGNDNWSDDDDDRDASGEAPETSPVSTQRSSSTTIANLGKKQTCRKSMVEILELEEEFDRNNPVAIPTVTSAALQGSISSSANGGAQRWPTAKRQYSESPNSCSMRYGEGGSDSIIVRELRRPRLLSTLFCMNTVQSPVSYLRLTMWQDRLLLLFTDEDKELLRSDQRARFKREARLELTEGSLVGVLTSSFTWSTNTGSSTDGHRTSAQGRRSFTISNSRNTGAAASGSGGGGGGGDSGSSSSGAGVSSAKPFSLIRRLILCLALEEERSSVQLYADVVQLCAHLCHSALLKTITVTRGTRDGLQQAAADVLASGLPVTSCNGGKALCTQHTWEGNSTLSASERESLRLLSDTLELALTVSLLIGSYGNAVEYAVQRVHALCLLEGDTTAVVNAAQRDLLEAYLFYGDYVTAVTIAEDVVMLTEQLCVASPDAYEVAEAEALCTLACVAAGRRDRLAHYITRLELRVLPMECPNGVTTIPLPLQQAQLRLVLSFAKMSMAYANPGTSAADGVPLLREAVRLLRGNGDLQEMEQSFSIAFPSQARLPSAHDSHCTNAPPSSRGRVSSMASCSITAGPLPDNRSSTANGNNENVVKEMMAAQKRLRWNLLSFAGALLVANDETEEGIGVMENTVKELVLGHHRYVERTHRSSIAAILWVGLVASKSWAQPTSKEDFASMLREVTSRVVRIKGPLHPFAAAANLQYVDVAHHSLNSRHGLSLVARSLSVLENAVSPQSHYLLTAHYLFGSMAESQQRWRPALEHLSAAYAIAQATHLCEHDLLHLGTRFIGALLNCPQTVIVEMDTTALRSQVEQQLERVRQFAGPHSEELAEPLWNMAEVHYLFKQPASAVECLQRAVQLLDRRGILYASAHVLRPVDVLRLDHQKQQQQREASAVEPKSITQLIQHRNAVVQTSFDSVHQALHLATTLYMLGAVLESQARTTEAQEKYEQCLAILEALQLGTNSLPAARVMTAIAKLLYTTANCGDALAWARKAELLLHVHYRKQWPLELENAEKLVAIIERRLYEEEGAYVMQSDVPAQDGLPQLL